MLVIGEGERGGKIEAIAEAINFFNTRPDGQLYKWRCETGGRGY